MLVVDASLIKKEKFLGSDVDATILPWWKTQIFNNSQVARYKYMISGSGLVTTLFLGFFFFQAEDGIRDGHVTGVQTCALPIYHRPPRSPDDGRSAVTTRREGG